MKIEKLTIAIPVLNGGAMLAECLDVIGAQRNDSNVEMELLVVDSGSTDGSDTLAERRGARVIRIDKSEFSHGGTRNTAVSEARGDAVAFLTQDATPASDRWLDAIVEGFAQGDDVALVFGPHLPRPDHSHVVRREMIDHFKTWGEGDAIVTQRIESGMGSQADYEQNSGSYRFFSDVNGAVARWAWERVPYREVPYAEDQLLGREMIEAGFAKVFHPEMAVIHSHDYKAVDFMKRYFDEYRGLREVLGYVAPIGVRSSTRTVLGLTRGDRGFLRAEGVHGRRLFTASLYSARHHSLRLVGEALGGRADRLPRWLSRRCSLEGRAGFSAVEPTEPPASIATGTSNGD